MSRMFSTLDILLLTFYKTVASYLNTLSLHDALPICAHVWAQYVGDQNRAVSLLIILDRSEEHTSELQSLRHLVCRLLLEKKETFRHQLRILFTVDAWHEEKCVNMLGTFVRNWVRYET